MTRDRAIGVAIRLSRKDGKPRFVFSDEAEDGGYAVASEFDADTWYDGDRPVFCTEDSARSGSTVT